MQQDRPEQQHIERRGRLQEDGVGGGGEAVGQNEADQRGRVTCRHRQHAPAPRASRFRNDGQKKQRRDAERKLAICQPPRDAALMAAPPVENSAAAATI